MGPSSMFFLLVGGLLVLSKVEASSSREGVDNSSSDSRRMFGCAAWCQWVPTASYQYVADCENCGQPYAGHPQTPQPVAAAQDFCIKASTCDECCNLPDSYCVQQECWMCQADKTSANCANCWAQKCMPQCTECYHSAAPAAAPPVVDTPEPTPSSVPGCPSGFKDCGECMCVPEDKCQFCPGVSRAEPVATEPSQPNEGSSPIGTHEPVAAAKDFCIKDSTCDACCNKPDSYCVEQKCWMCQTDKSSANCANCWAEKCMPQCTKCYHSAASTAAPPVVDTPAPTPSSVPGCPSGYKDCGACRCVPENTCQWCPGAHASHGSSHSSPRRRYGSIRPTQVPFCPTNYKDCGVCLCVPESTCQWCPGVFDFEAEVNGTEPVQEFLP
eukprot:TRINITY_DN788_c0_g1_i12.p1 TRINITY_DN788_c0_g1~~TRINITY_DN788_c0_g1_i12.p1  ORF type:complete len:417 (+),score=87.14 TRINITY_DN788_c0_g1_i12:102-1253(+)